MAEIDFFVSEFLCYAKYMRAIFHLRPFMNIKSAHIVIGGDRYKLDNIEKIDHVELFGDFLTDGIENSHDAIVRIRLGDGRSIEINDIVERQLLSHDPVSQLNSIFVSYIEKNIENLDVLEIGSRDREDTLSSWNRLRTQSRSYTGLDIVEGPNVDVVGDAHLLSNYFNRNQFDFIYSQYAFEHLAMPWLAAIEMNKVMKIGGEAYILERFSIILDRIRRM